MKTIKRDFNYLDKMNRRRRREPMDASARGLVLGMALALLSAGAIVIVWIFGFGG